MMFWKEEVSKWSWLEQQQLMITLIGKQNKEEQEGRAGSNLHRYAKHLAEFISQQSNIQSQMKREQHVQSTDTDEPQFPEISENPDIKKDSDKTIQIGLLLSEFISQQSNIQSQTKREQQVQSTDADEPQTPKILMHQEIREEFDKAIHIGILKDYYTLKASNMLLACFVWGICKHYNVSTKAKSGKNKGGFAADWKAFDFIKDKDGKTINLKQSWQNAKNKTFNPQKLSGFSFWEHLCNKLYINE